MPDRPQCAIPHCGAPPMRNEQYCFAHHPDHRARMNAARKKAAKASRRLIIDPPRSVADLKRVTGEVMAAVAAGKLSPLQARTIERMITLYLKTHEAVEVDHRLARLEAEHATNGD